MSMSAAPWNYSHKTRWLPYVHRQHNAHHNNTQPTPTVPAQRFVYMPTCSVVGLFNATDINGYRLRCNLQWYKLHTVSMVLASHSVNGSSFTQCQWFKLHTVSMVLASCSVNVSVSATSSSMGGVKSNEHSACDTEFWHFVDVQYHRIPGYS